MSQVFLCAQTLPRDNAHFLISPQLCSSWRNLAASGRQRFETVPIDIWQDSLDEGSDSYQASACIGQLLMTNNHVFRGIRTHDYSIQVTKTHAQDRVSRRVRGREHFRLQSQESNVGNAFPSPSVHLN